MGRKLTKKEKNRLNKDIWRILQENFKLLIKVMVFVFVALIIFFTVTYYTGGRAIPYLALIYMISFGFVFRNQFYRKKMLYSGILNRIDIVLIVVVALIFVAMAVTMSGK